MLTILVAIPAWAAPAEPLTLSRPLAMSEAYRAAGSANGAIYSNPAGISRLTLYSVEWSWLRGDHTGGDDDTFALSIVDTKTQPFGVGLGYSFLPGDSDRHDGRLALAYAMMPRRLYGGTTFRYLLLDPEKGDSQSAIAVDAGLMLNVGAGLMLGVVGHNLLPDPGLTDTSKRSWGGGIAYEAGSFTLETDVVYDHGADPEEGGGRFAYHVGAELMLSPNLPIRAGWSRAPAGGGTVQHLSAGLGWITKAGALDFGYSQRLDGSESRSFALGVRSFF
jgi:hypothetical protein